MGKSVCGRKSVGGGGGESEETALEAHERLGQPWRVTWGGIATGRKPSVKVKSLEGGRGA